MQSRLLGYTSNVNDFNKEENVVKIYLLKDME